MFCCEGLCPVRVEISGGMFAEQHICEPGRHRALSGPAQEETRLITSVVAQPSGSHEDRYPIPIPIKSSNVIIRYAVESRTTPATVPQETVL